MTPFMELQKEHLGGIASIGLSVPQFEHSK